VTRKNSKSGTPTFEDLKQRGDQARAVWRRALCDAEESFRASKKLIQEIRKTHQPEQSEAG